MSSCALWRPEGARQRAQLLKLRSLAASTQAEYLRYIRKLATRVGHDPATLDEAQVRAHVLHLFTSNGAHSMSFSFITGCLFL